jgi:hypothetical protein
MPFRPPTKSSQQSDMLPSWGPQTDDGLARGWAIAHVGLSVTEKPMLRLHSQAALLRLAEKYA